MLWRLLTTAIPIEFWEHRGDAELGSGKVDGRLEDGWAGAKTGVLLLLLLL